MVFDAHRPYQKSRSICCAYQLRNQGLVPKRPWCWPQVYRLHPSDETAFDWHTCRYLSLLLASQGGRGTGEGSDVGDKGMRGTLASTGFCNETAVPPPSCGKKGTLQNSGIDDQSAPADAPKRKAISNEGVTTPVDILEKPRPEYTAEGHSLKIEGDVVLEMVFLAGGSVQVNRVVSGLGHGLDRSNNSCGTTDQVQTGEARKPASGFSGSGAY